MPRAKANRDVLFAGVSRVRLKFHSLGGVVKAREQCQEKWGCLGVAVSASEQRASPGGQLWSSMGEGSSVQRRKDLGSHLYVKKIIYKITTPPPRTSCKGELNSWVSSWVYTTWFQPALATQGIKNTKWGDFPERKKAELLPERVEARFLGHL